MSVASLPLCAQTSPELEIIATHTAETAAKAHPQRVLASSLDGCLQDAQVCAAYHGALRASMERLLPNVQFVTQEEVAHLLKRHGFLGIDAYNSVVLRAIAPEASADVLVIENLGWASSGYELTGEVFDAHSDKSLHKFKANVARRVPDDGIEPTVIKDPDTGISLVIYKQKKSGFPVFHYVICEICPDPRYAEEARRKGIGGTVVLLATVTEQGMPREISLVKGLDPGLDSAAREGVQSWHFKPAVGLDGNAISVRVPIVVTFRISPDRQNWY